MKRLFKSMSYWAIIVFLALNGPLWLFVGELYIVPKLGTELVAVATKNIERGSKVNSSNFQMVYVKRDRLVSGSINDAKLVDGKEVTTNINANEQITADRVNTKHLYPSKDEVNVRIPTEWIMGKAPGSILRGDRVTLDPIKPKETLVRQGNADTQSMGSESKELTVSSEDTRLLRGITVSYVKSSNNKEVESGDDRKSPTAAVTDIEVILSETQKELLNKLGSAGYKFLVSYY